MEAAGYDFIPGPGAGSPNPDGPGDPAWQRATALLARVQAQEQARRN